MAGLRLLVLLCVIDHIFCIDKILGDPVEFPATETCKKRRARLVQRMNNGWRRLVAYWDGVWEPGPGYLYRMSPNDSVILDSANMNDNGLYELTCGGEGDTSIQLNVVEASEVSVIEGGTVRFPFHYVTAREEAKYRLEKDGKPVFQVDLSSGVIRYGLGVWGRAFVSSGWEVHGDLTLTVNKVKPGDEGDYFLSYITDQERKTLSAVRMKLTQKQKQQMGTCTVVGITAAAVFVVVVPLSLWCSWKLRSCRSKASSGPGGGGSPRDVEMGLLTERSPAGFQVVIV